MKHKKDSGLLLPLHVDASAPDTFAYVKRLQQALERLHDKQAADTAGKMPTGAASPEMITILATAVSDLVNLAADMERQLEEATELLESSATGALSDKSGLPVLSKVDLARN